MKSRLSRLFIPLFVYSFIRLFVYSQSALASEGIATLTGSTPARCYFASVLIDENRYKIVAACRDLTVPPESETLFYRLWGKRLGASAPTPGARISSFGRGVYLGLGDITSGKLSSDAREPFDEILVTAEKEANPSNPNLDKIILSGSIQPIDYGISGVGETLKPTSPLARVTLEPTVSPPPAGGSAVSSGKSVVGTAFRIFLTVLLIIVAVAVIISVIQRRSASK